MPVPEIVEYSIAKLRARGLRLRSIHHRAEALGLTLQFLGDRSIDLISRANGQIFLSLNELVALADWCRRPKGARATKLVVGPGYAAVRYATAIDYMLWVFEPVIARISEATARHAASVALRRFLTRSRSVAPRVRGSSSLIDGERHGLREDQRKLFLKVIHPDDPGNPFSAKARARNHALLLLTFKLGARSGEVPDDALIVVSYNKVRVDVRKRIWPLALDISLDWRSFPKVGAILHSSLHSFLVQLVKTLAPKTVMGYFSGLRHCMLAAMSLGIDVSSPENFDVALVDRLRCYINDHVGEASVFWGLHAYRRWYQWCSDAGLEAFAILKANFANCISGHARLHSTNEAHFLLPRHVPPSPKKV